MCQVYGGPDRVACARCGAGFYEDTRHACKVFESFARWDERRKLPWPEWQRRYAWAEENRFTVEG